MLKAVGTDPAMRHTGLSLLAKGEPQFRQFNSPTNQNIVDTKRQLEAWCDKTFTPLRKKIPIFAMERQISAGAESSALQYLAQTIVLDAALSIIEPEYIVMPLPIQLKSYARKQLGFTVTSPGQIVRSFKELTGYQGRISQHCVDGWLVARLAQDVVDGKWEYKLPSKDVQPFSGIITNGSSRAPSRPDQQDQEEA